MKEENERSEVLMEKAIEAKRMVRFMDTFFREMFLDRAISLVRLSRAVEGLEDVDLLLDDCLRELKARQ